MDLVNQLYERLAATEQRAEAAEAELKEVESDYRNCCADRAALTKLLDRYAEALRQ